MESINDTQKCLTSTNLGVSYATLEPINNHPNQTKKPWTCFFLFVETSYPDLLSKNWQTDFFSPPKNKPEGETLTLVSENIPFIFFT